MAGRAAVLSWEEAKAANPCILADHQGAYEYGGMKYELVAHPSGPTFDACSKLVKVVLRQDLACGAPQVRVLARSQMLSPQCLGKCGRRLGGWGRRGLSCSWISQTSPGMVGRRGMTFF